MPTCRGVLGIFACGAEMLSTEEKSALQGSAAGLDMLPHVLHSCLE